MCVCVCVCAFGFNKVRMKGSSALSFHRQEAKPQSARQIGPITSIESHSVHSLFIGKSPKAASIN